MYLDYFHFTQAPFSITPDPEFVYLSEKHQESLAHLVYGVTRGGGAGFVQLTGEVGTGKTTISRLFLQKLPENTQAALILNPNITPLELLENIFKEFGLATKGVKGQLNAMIDRLNSHLLKWYEAGKNTVIIIDEAQNIPRDTLEQLRLLTNLETSQQKLLQIVLIGQPELKTTMKRRDLRQLSQRITSRFHLMPLSAKETEDYIRHRLSVAGVEKALFTSAACQKVFALTAGTPRMINSLCDRALLTAFVAESDMVRRKHIVQAAKEVFGDTSKRAWHFKMPAVIALSLIMILLWVVMAWRQEDKSGNVATKLVEQAVVKKTTTIKTPANNAAWQAYFQLWHPDESLLWTSNQCPSTDASGMACLRRQGNLNQIKRLNTPVLLEISSQQLLLLVAVEGQQWQVWSADGMTNIRQADIEQQWFGTYFVLWPLAEELIGDTMSQNLAKWVQSMAFAIDKQTIQPQQIEPWVKTFQQKNGLLADGIVGKETQMALALKAYQGPKLQ